MRRPEVQEFVRDLSEGKRLAPRTVRECYRILGGLMRAAVDAGLIPESPCQRVTLPRVTREERRFLSAQELENLAGAIDAHYSALIHAGGYLGLRG